MENTSYLSNISKGNYRVREIEHKCLKQLGVPSLHPAGQMHPGIEIDADQQYIIMSLFKIWEIIFRFLNSIYAVLKHELCRCQCLS